MADLALNRPVVVSSVDALSPTLVGSNAVDGNGATRWASERSDPQWIYVDLGSLYAVNRVVLVWEAAYGSSYKIQISTDATNWTDIYSTTTGNGGTDDLTGLSGTGRYVRMYGTVRATTYGYSLWSFEVYGTDAQAPTAPSGLSANPSGSTVSLSWTASTDNVGVTAYDVHRSVTSGFTPGAGNLLGTVTGAPPTAAYSDTGVADGTYYYKVIAKDAAANASSASNEASATVSSGGGVSVTPTAARILLAEVDAYDPGTSSVITYRFSDLLGFDNGGTFYAPRIEHPAYMRRDASSALLGGRAANSYGELTLFNQDGALNAMADDYFDGRQYRLFLGDESLSFASFQKVLVATVETVSLTGGMVSVRFRDRTAALDVPFSSVQYAGTNALPLGIEGTADDIKSQYKPRLFGRVALMQPMLVNTSKLIYQVCNGAIDAVVNVFDAGAYLGREADYSSQADMEANQPSKGYYRVWPGGGCFRLRSSAYGQISASVAEKWTHTSISAAGIIQRILSEIGWTASDYVAADFTALDQKCCGPLGVIVEGGETIAALLDRICATVGAWWGFDQLNRFRVGRLDAPGTPVLTITDENIKDGQIDIAPPSEQPTWQTTVQADRNYAVQDKRGMAGVVTDARIAWFSAETRDQKASDSNTKTWRLLAQDKVYPSLFSSISQGQAEATRRLSLLSARRDVVTVTLGDPMSYINALDIGSTVQVVSSEIGYGAGRNMTVIGMGPNYKDDYLDLILWG